MKIHPDYSSVRRAGFAIEKRQYKSKQESGIIAGVCFLLMLAILLICGLAHAEINIEKIKQIESSGNPLAYNSRSGAIGLYQITSICLKEYNAYHPTNTYESADLYDPVANRNVAEWYLTERIPQMLRHYDKDVSTRNILIAYNAGISYVVSGKRLPEETVNYLKKYGV